MSKISKFTVISISEINSFILLSGILGSEPKKYGNHILDLRRSCKHGQYYNCQIPNYHPSNLATGLSGNFTEILRKLIL